MLFTFDIKKWSIAITIVTMTFLIACISVFVTRYFDKKLCIKRNNASTAKSLTLKQVINANKTTGAKNVKKKQETNSDVKKHDNKNDSIERNVDVTNNDIKKDIKNDIGNNISPNNEKKVANENKIVTNKNSQKIVALVKDKTTDIQSQQFQEDAKIFKIVNTRNSHADDKVITKNDIIVNINIIKEEKDKSETKKITKSVKKKDNKNKKVVKTRSFKKLPTIKKNKIKVRQKIVKSSNDEKKIEEKSSHDANNIIPQESKNDKIMPKVIQEVEKPELQKNEENNNNIQQEDDVDDAENSEIHNTIIVED